MSTLARSSHFSSSFAQFLPLEQISFSSPLAMLTQTGLPILKLRGLAHIPRRAEPGWLRMGLSSPPCPLLRANAFTSIPWCHLPS